MSIRFSRSLASAAALAGILSVSVAAYAKLSKAGTSQTAFKVAGPAGLTIEGKTADMSVADDGTNVTITVPLANIDTGIGLRNEHTKKALEADKYPNVILVVARSALKLPAPSSGDAPGKLTLHGQTKDVTVHYSASGGSPMSITGNFHINMNDYGVTPPTYLGVGVKPDVDVNTSFQANDN